jgi:hypothetical protein
MSIPKLESLTSATKGASEIIDGFPNTNYGFLDVSVEYRICLWLRALAQNLGREIQGGLRGFWRLWTLFQ